METDILDLVDPNGTAKKGGFSNLQANKAVQTRSRHDVNRNSGLYGCCSNTQHP